MSHGVSSPAALSQSVSQGAPKSPPQLITGKADLLHYFELGCKASDQLYVGMEVEKFAVERTTGKVISYFANNGVKAIQEKLITEQGWQVQLREEKFLLALKRGDTRLTFEHDGTLEFSGRTHVTIHDLAREFRLHQQEVSEISKLFGVVWLGIGFLPFSTSLALKRSLPRRYAFLQDYFKSKSFKKGMLSWWRHCAAIQANFDYISEEDAMKKAQLILRVTPIVTAMFAHSPLAYGKPTGFASYRRNIITSIDSPQFHLPDHFFSRTLSFQDWVDYYLSLPMLAIVRDGVWYHMKDMTFATFLKEGCHGYVPTLDDWVLHLSFVYTDVRIRHYIESRACDTVPPAFVPAFQALMKSLIYAPKSHELIMALTKEWKAKDFRELNAAVAKEGMQAKVNGKTILTYARELLSLASDHLKANPHLNAEGKDETVYLEPIKDFVFVKEKSLGRYVAEQWEGEWHGNPQRLIEWCAY